MRLTFLLLGYFAIGNLIGLLDTLLRAFISDDLEISFWDFLSPQFYYKNPLVLLLAVTSVLQFGVYLKAFDVASQIGGTGTASIATAAGMFVAALFVALNYIVFSLYRNEKLSSTAMSYLLVIITLQLLTVNVIYLLIEELEKGP